MELECFFFHLVDVESRVWWQLLGVALVVELGVGRKQNESPALASLCLSFMLVIRL